MGIKSGYLSLHNGGIGAEFEITVTGSRRFVSFPIGHPDGKMLSDQAISFAGMSSADATLSGSSYSNIISGTLGLLDGEQPQYSMSFVAALYGSGTPAGTPMTYQHLYYGVRVGLWDRPTDGRFLENVQFTNISSPFTISGSGDVNFAAGSLSVLAE